MKNKNNHKLTNIVIGIKGAGDLATGIACRLFNSNIKKIYLMENTTPFSVRRYVSFSDAVYNGNTSVEGITAILINSHTNIYETFKKKKIPVLIDPTWKTITDYQPNVLIDAIMAKKNTGTFKNHAPLVIGLGPGFTAGKDVSFVIETKRGHNLGKIIDKGTAKKNTSIPKKINGFSFKRVLKSPSKGFLKTNLKIGDFVNKNQLIGKINETPIFAQIDGIIRGLINEKVKTKKGTKIGDIDPRNKKEYCYSISDKAKAIGGSVLELILKKYNI